VVFKSGAGDITLFIGSSAGQGRTAIRLAGAKEIHGVAGLRSSTFPVAAKSWVEGDYFEVDHKQVKSLNISNKNGTFALTSTVAGWEASADGVTVTVPPGKRFAKSKLEGIAGSVAKIRLKEPGTTKANLSTSVATYVLGVVDAQSGQTSEHTFDVYEVAGKTVVHDRERANAAIIDGDEVDELLKLSSAELIEDIPADGDKAKVPPGKAPPGLPPGFMPQ